MHRYLVTMALMMVFGTSAYMSVCGLAAVFSAHLPVVVCMGIGMELGKLLVVIHLHRWWGVMGIGGRLFYMAVAAALVLITSCEIMGYLAQSHTVTSRDLAAAESAVAALDREADLLHRQIAVTDATLAGLPEGYVTRRIVERQKAGYGAAQERLVAIARQRAELTAGIVDKAAQAGPVFAVARLAGLDASVAATIFILMLVAVLEPLSIGLAVAASAAWMPQAAAAPAAEDEPAGSIMKGPAGRVKARRELMDIVRVHDLTETEVAAIVGRKRSAAVVRAWMEGSESIPPRVLRTLRRWSRRPRNRLKVVGGVP